MYLSGAIIISIQQHHLLTSNLHANYGTKKWRVLFVHCDKQVSLVDAASSYDLELLSSWEGHDNTNTVWSVCDTCATAPSAGQEADRTQVDQPAALWPHQGKKEKRSLQLGDCVVLETSHSHSWCDPQQAKGPSCVCEDTPHPPLSTHTN